MGPAGPFFIDQLTEIDFPHFLPLLPAYSLYRFRATEAVIDNSEDLHRADPRFGARVKPVSGQDQDGTIMV